MRQYIIYLPSHLADGAELSQGLMLRLNQVALNIFSSYVLNPVVMQHAIAYEEGNVKQYGVRDMRVVSNNFKGVEQFAALVAGITGHDSVTISDGHNVHYIAPADKVGLPEPKANGDTDAQ